MVRRFGSFVVVAVAVSVLLLSGAVSAARAATASELATYISGRGLNASASGNTVTVSGDLNGVLSSQHAFSLNIDADVTVVWEASLQGAPGSNSLIYLNGGTGTFYMESGLIEVTSGSGRAITNNTAGAVIIWSGTVKAVSGNAINNASTGTIDIDGGASVSTTSGAVISNSNSSGTITISGGTINATGSNTAISNSGTVNVTGGTISAVSGTAISGGTKNISGGTVSTTTGTGISGSATISGGTVSATTGMAISISSSSNTITISDDAIITSANTSSSNGTINVTGGTLNINGGIVLNTATAGTSSRAIYISAMLQGSTINITGGTVSTSVGNAIHAHISNTTNITGGTIYAPSDGYAFYLNNTYVSLNLGRSPNINGRIHSLPDRLSVFTATDTATFAPEGTRRYTLDFPEAEYAVAKVAVVNGGNFHENFILHKPDFALSTQGQHLVIASAAQTQTVTFNLNGGTGTPPNSFGVVSGTKIPASWKPPASDYTRTISGVNQVSDGEWYTSSTEQTEATKFVFDAVNGTTVNSNLTLYLQWTPTLYTITYSLNSGTVTPANPTAYTIETATFTLTNPTRAGYTFDGWTGTNGTTPEKTILVPLGSSGDRNYTANWTLITYTVTFDANGGTVSTATGTTGNNWTLASLPTPTRAHYDFVGWFTAATGGTQITTSTAFSANATIYARWTPTPYTITYSLNNGTVATANPATYTIETADFTLTNPTRNGYTFDGWTGTGIKTAQTSVTVEQGSTENRTYTANWTQAIIPVTDITGVPSEIGVGVQVTLTGTVAPTGATNKTIIWSVVSAGNTEAGIFNGNTLFAQAAGTIVIRATIVGGKGDGTDYVKEFTITVSTVSVLSNDRKIPDAASEKDAAVVAPVAPLSFEFAVGPNPVRKSDGVVNIFVAGKRVYDGTLTVFDATGNVVGKIDIFDNAMIGDLSKREVGSWDLKDAKGNAVPAGTYLVRGTVKTVDGKRERVSVVVGVR